MRANSEIVYGVDGAEAFESLEDLSPVGLRPVALCIGTIKWELKQGQQMRLSICAVLSRNTKKTSVRCARYLLSQSYSSGWFKQLYQGPLLCQCNTCAEAWRSCGGMINENRSIAVCCGDHYEYAVCLIRGGDQLLLHGA